MKLAPVRVFSCKHPLTLLLFCRPRCRRRRRCLSSLLGRKEAGEKEKKARRGRWEGERREARPFPSSHRPPRAWYFSIIARRTI